MFHLTKEYRDGIFGISIQIIPTWKNITNQEKEISKYLLFNINTYNLIKKDAITLLKPVYDFIDSLSIQEQKTIFQMFYNIKSLILSNKITEYETKNYNLLDSHEIDFTEYENFVNKIITKISNIIFNTINDYNFIEKMKIFIKNHIPLPDLSKAGSRPQDNKETTFYNDEYLDFATLSLLCKLLSPVFGEIIFWFNKSSYLDKNSKEIYIIKLIQPILNTYFRDIINKLFIYIEKTGINTIYMDDDIQILFKGIDKTKIKIHSLSVIISKKLINIDLYDKNKDIIRYIYKCMQDTIKSQISSSNENIRIMERFDTSISEDSDDDQLTIETGNNLKIGTLLYLKMCIDDCIESSIYEFNLNKEEVNEISEYYYRKNIYLNYINETIVSCLLSKYLKIGFSIKYASYLQICKLISCSQLILCNLDPVKYFDVIHLISHEFSYKLKTNRSTSIYQLKFYKLNKDLQKIIHELLIDKTIIEKFENVIKYIVNLLFKYDLYYNSSPIIQENTNHIKQITNGDVIEYNSDVIDNIILSALQISDLIK